MTIRKPVAGTLGAFALFAAATAHGASHVANEDVVDAAGDTEVESSAIAQVAGPDGEVLGSVRITATPSGQMHLVWQLVNIPPGVHGIHVHETGDCSADDLKSAGGHLADGAPHGVMVEGGPHPGDLPNAHVGEDGRLFVEHFDGLLTMDMLMDADGSAVIVHSGPDDYTSQPSGDAGDRIACGVIEMSGQP